jgi:hypothetical protein
MKTILFERALSFGERPFDVLDLVLAGLAETSWQKLEADAAAGVAAEQELDARGAGPSLEEVQKAERAFRYERGLLAAADLEQWLAARRLARGEWRGVLRRALAREWLLPTASADATPVLRADAYCTGTLGRCALRLVAGVAAEGALGGSEDDESVATRIVEAARASTASCLETVEDVELERRARTVARLEHAREDLLVVVASAEDVERCLAGHVLDWLQFETAELEVASEDAAREALLCVRTDGLTLAEVGLEVGRKPARRVRTFEETDDVLSSQLAAAQPGDLVGPVAVDGSFVIAQLLAKTRPSADDPAMVERARAELFAAAVSRHTAGRVTWHAAL